jgi:hypothetical protein
MPLAALPNVPYVLAGEVQGLDGTRVLPVVAEPRDRCVLWVIERQMAGAQLDLAAVDALLALLTEAAAAMRAATGTPPDAEPQRS